MQTECDIPHIAVRGCYMFFQPVYVFMTVNLASYNRKKSNIQI